MDIIEHISEAGALGISELSAQFGLPPSTIHRILATLTSRGYVWQNTETRRYALSPKKKPVCVVSPHPFLITPEKLPRQYRFSERSIELPGNACRNWLLG